MGPDNRSDFLDDLGGFRGSDTKEVVLSGVGSCYFFDWRELRFAALSLPEVAANFISTRKICVGPRKW